MVLVVVGDERARDRHVVFRGLVQEAVDVPRRIHQQGLPRAERPHEVGEIGHLPHRNLAKVEVVLGHGALLGRIRVRGQLDLEMAILLPHGVRADVAGGIIGAFPGARVEGVGVEWTDDFTAVDHSLGETSRGVGALVVDCKIPLGGAADAEFSASDTEAPEFAFGKVIGRPDFVPRECHGSVLGSGFVEAVRDPTRDDPRDLLFHFLGRPVGLLQNPEVLIGSLHDLECRGRADAK